jgi:hypothetical protein
MSVKGLQLLPFVFAVVATAASAQEQPRSMLGGSFDLKGAMLSPTPLGPPSQFEPTPVAAPPVAAKPEAAPIVAKSEVPAARKTVSSKPRTVSSKPRQKAAVAARKPKSNPLDSYARDTRRQSWPCTGGGGICAWR